MRVLSQHIDFFGGNLFGAQSNPSEIHEKNTEGTKPELWIHHFSMIRLRQQRHLVG